MARKARSYVTPQYLAWLAPRVADPLRRQTKGWKVALYKQAKQELGKDLFNVAPSAHFREVAKIEASLANGRAIAPFPKAVVWRQDVPQGNGKTSALISLIDAQIKTLFNLGKADTLVTVYELLSKEVAQACR